MMAGAGYAHVKKHLFSAEVVIGGSIDVKELQGLRLYGGWDYTGSHGATLGGLIYLAW